MGFVLLNKIKEYLKREEFKPLLIVFFELVSVFIFFFSGMSSNKNLLSIISPIPSVLSLIERKNSSEVFGFAPYWKFDNLNSVDFSVLTTFAYFGIPVNADGTLDKADQGYVTFKSEKATKIFNKAHESGTKVVLTITQMDNTTIEQLMDNNNAQNEAINETVQEVKDKGIDGVNVDFEYMGDPGDDYRAKFSNFIKKLNDKLHQNVPNSYLTVSVYASSVKDPKIYDITKISQNSDGIFMMAYDFATASAGQAMPTSPLYGYKNGTYWYDVSTAVNDFLKYMPADKLILGLPWYGYNYPVDSPAVNANVDSGYYTYYWYRYRKYWEYHDNPSMAQTYSAANDNINPSNTAITNITTGWDNVGKVGWKAYYDQNLGTWRMIFLDDPKSMSIKYDFAKNKNLGGVGIWALGFDEGKQELWSTLKEKFGSKLAKAGLQ